STSKTPSYTKSVSWQHHPAYISKANRLDAEIIALKAKYERNVLALADIIEYIDNATPIKVEDMLADDLIRELAERKKIQV
ncbi:hypothetical protein AWP51_00180, partial [Escherichia coli]